MISTITGVFNRCMIALFHLFGIVEFFCACPSSPIDYKYPFPVFGAIFGIAATFLVSRLEDLDSSFSAFGLRFPKDSLKLIVCMNVLLKSDFIEKRL